MTELYPSYWPRPIPGSHCAILALYARHKKVGRQSGDGGGVERGGERQQSARFREVVGNMAQIGLNW